MSCLYSTDGYFLEQAYSRYKVQVRSDNSDFLIWNRPNSDNFRGTGMLCTVEFFML